jgi:hypothetical protein
MPLSRNSSVRWIFLVYLVYSSMQRSDLKQFPLELKFAEIDPSLCPSQYSLNMLNFTGRIFLMRIFSLVKAEKFLEIFRILWMLWYYYASSNALIFIMRILLFRLSHSLTTIYELRMPGKKSRVTAIPDDFKGTVSWKAQTGYSILAKEDSSFCLILKFFYLHIRRRSYKIWKKSWKMALSQLLLDQIKKNQNPFLLP